MKQRVLILCTGNSCRSQMAEGVLRHYGSEKFDVFSAGTQPSQVNKTAIQVMRELGIDISKQTSKDVKGFLGQHFHYVITVCDKADKACPIFPGPAMRLHWFFPDPPHSAEVTEPVLQEFRNIRDSIHTKFKQMAETGKAE